MSPTPGLQTTSLLITTPKNRWFLLNKGNPAIKAQTQ
ncbi:hypothetical protein TNCV_2272051, partial [Trichonephila clavipes]